MLASLHKSTAPSCRHVASLWLFLPLCFAVLCFYFGDGQREASSLISPLMWTTKRVCALLVQVEKNMSLSEFSLMADDEMTWKMCGGQRRTEACRASERGDGRRRRQGWDTERHGGGCYSCIITSTAISLPLSHLLTLLFTLPLIFSFYYSSSLFVSPSLVFISLSLSSSVVQTLRQMSREIFAIKTQGEECLCTRVWGVCVWVEGLTHACLVCAHFALGLEVCGVFWPLWNEAHLCWIEEKNIKGSGMREIKLAAENCSFPADRTRRDVWWRSQPEISQATLHKRECSPKHDRIEEYCPNFVFVRETRHLISPDLKSTLRYWAKLQTVEDVWRLGVFHVTAWTH